MRKFLNHDFIWQSAIAFTIRIIAAFSAFFLSVVITRVLGVEQSGYYFLTFTLVSVLAVFSRIGLDQTLLRFTSEAFSNKNSFQIKDVLLKSLLITVPVSGVLSFFLYILSDIIANELFGQPGMAEPIKNMACGIIGLSVITHVSISLQAMGHIICSIIIINIGINLLLIGALLIFSLTDAQELATYFSMASLTIIVLSFLYWKYIQPVSGSSKKVTISWSVLYQSCMPLWVVMISAQLIQWSAQLIAGAWVSPAELSMLAVAQRTAMLTSFVLVAVNLVVAPRFAAMFKRGDLKGVEHMAKLSVFMMALFSLPIVVFMLIFPEFIMSIYGEKFIGGACLLQILVLGQFINVVTGSVGYLLSMTGNEKKLRNSMIFSAPFAVIASLILVPIYGATGSAIATALAVSVQNLLASWHVKQALGFNTFAIWRKLT